MNKHNVIIILSIILGVSLITNVLLYRKSQSDFQALVNTPQDVKTATCKTISETKLEDINLFCNSDLFHQILQNNPEIKQADCLKVGYVKELAKKEGLQFLRACEGIIDTRATTGSGQFIEEKNVDPLKHL